MITFPSWAYFISVPLVFPLLYLIIKKKLNLELKSDVSKQLIYQISAVAGLVFCCIAAMDVFKSDIVAVVILYPLAILFLISIFYILSKKLIDYRNLLKSMSQNIDVGMQEMTAASEQITMSAQNIAQKALDINTSSINIKNLLELLQIISDQINLLALNATIEAGRLGSEARGFMAVASELQKLHDQTKNQIKQSTNEVKTILTEIREFSNHTTEITSATEEQTSSMEEIMELIEKLNKEVSI
jgi:hypothetical protein